MRAVIFDMGGTLLQFVRPGNGTWREFEERGIRGLYRYLAEQGHKIGDHEEGFVEAMFQRLEEGWRQATGGTVSLRAQDWIAQAIVGVELDEQTIMQAVHHYARPLRQGIAPTRGAVETLTALRDRGYRIGLISNTIWPAEIHIDDLRQTHLLPYLEHMIFSGDEGIWKPDPRIFQRSLEALGVAPGEAVFVGDSPREDVLGSQAAGMRAVWKRSREFPQGDVQPDAIITDLPELLPLLEAWADQPPADGR